MVRLVRFIMCLSWVTLLLLLSQSHQTAAVDVLMPSRRAAVVQLQEADEHTTSFQPRMLGVYIRKRAGARGGTLVGGAGGRRSSSSSSSAVPTHIPNPAFHFASILGYSFLLVIFLL
ncbi:hypothetical protein V6N13_097522 [Hibiscus sabdariffa]|uniref:Transmembrane protein n=1 Tax=Hibiscus sabdariffa TaxID=183260 RepID=A0ABR2PCY8_9ROSI